VGSLFALLDIAQSGLAAQSAGLDATGQNVSNVNTPGYSEVTAKIETTETVDGFSGGAQVAGMNRAFDALTFGNLLTQQGLGGAADARSSALSQAESLVAPNGQTIGDNIDSFFQAMQSLETSPSDPSARTEVLAQATQLAQSVATAAGGLTTLRDSLLAQAQGTATQLNGELSQIATLNTEISRASAAGGSPTDLEDQRDELASQVSTQIGAQVITDANGNYTLLSSGTALVADGSAATVAVGVDGSDNLKITSTMPGGIANDVTQNVTQGTLGGLREARDTDIPATSAQLDQLAFGFANAVNSIQSAGYGLDGVTGRNLFLAPGSVVGAASAMAVDPAVENDPSAIAASTTAAGIPGGNDNAIALAALASQPFGASATPADAYGAIASDLGTAASTANAEQSLRQATITQAQSLNSSASGVSLDEQMTNLDQFQRAYEASADVLQTTNTLLGELMQDF